MKRARWIILCLLVGAVGNVAVAWWFARTPAIETASDVRFVVGTYRLSDGDVFNRRGQRVTTIEVDVTATRTSGKQRYAFGWPLRPMAYDVIREMRTGDAAEVGFDLGTHRFTSQALLAPDRYRFCGQLGRHRMPLMPTLAFVPSVVLYGSVVWAALASAAWVRRALSRRWGLCAACRYDLTGIDGPCPECGAHR